MFWILRFVVVVGVIFYFSPVRQTADGAGLLDGLRNGTKTADAPKAAGEGPAGIGTMWQALPDAAKQTVIDGIVASAATAGAARPPSDTLHATDRQPAWRGTTERPHP